MPTLIVGNVDNEHMVSEPWLMNYEQKCVSSSVANRLIWLIKNDDAILLPYAPSQAFLQYALNLMGVDYHTTTLVVPPTGRRETEILTFDVLSQPPLLEALMEISRPSKDWTMTPYFFDRSVAWLASKLEIGMNPNLLMYFRQGGAEQLNSKTEFRRIATAYNIPVAEGVICSSKRELLVSIQEIIRITGSVIIKQDLNAGGDGNIVVTTTSEKVAIGAFATLSIDGNTNWNSLVEELWSRLTRSSNKNLVVEAYYPHSTPYYSELEITSNFHVPHLLNFGEMRMEPIWVGFQIPCQTLSPYQLGEFLSVSMKLADIARMRGYVGKINCDAICTPDGQVLFTEVNGRLGGCTHIHILAKHLFGDNYGNHYTLLSRNHIKTGPFEDLLSLLNQKGILYTEQQRQGVIILTEDINRTGTVEYLVASPKQEDAYEIEQIALEVFKESANHQQIENNAFS